MSSDTKVLFLCHIENMFLDHPYGFDQEFLEMAEEVADSGEFGRVVTLTSMVDDLHPAGNLRYIADQDIEWGWGYEKGVGYDYEDCDVCDGQACDCWVILSHGHEWTWVPPELREFDPTGKEVWIAGGADGECLADLESIFDHLEISYNRLNQIIY